MYGLPPFVSKSFVVTSRYLVSMTKLIKKLDNDKDYEVFFEKKFFRWSPQHESSHI